MNTAKVNGKVGLVFLCRRTSIQRTKHFFDTNGTVVVNASLFGILQILIRTLINPLGSQPLITKPNGTNGTSRIAILTCLTAWSIYTKQTSCSLFFQVHLFVFHHSIMFCIIIFCICIVNCHPALTYLSTRQDTKRID